MAPVLNPDYELIYVDKEADKVFLKNQFFKNLVSLSTVEYEIIRFYSENPDPQKVFEHFSAQYEMPSDFIYLLVQKAEASGLLMSDNYLQRKEKIKTISGQRAENPWFYWGVTKVQSLLRSLGLSAKLELRGSFKYYKLVSFDLENTWIEKVCSRKSVQHTLIALYFITLVAMLYGIFSLESHHLTWDYNTIGRAQGFLSLLVLFGGVTVVSFFHELGHFILYKKFGGVTSEMGIALMTGIVPTMYVTTSSLPLWKHRWQRVLVMAGGTLVDVLLLVAFVYVGYTASSGVLSFYAFILSLMQVYRIYFNNNPLVPLTDGYFIVCDVFSNPTLHSNAYGFTTELMKKIKSFRLNAITLKEVGYTFYFACSMLFVILNYLMFLLPLTLIWR